jgi:hypothetical protein
LAESVVRYGLSAWGKTTQTNLKKVQSKQNSIVRLISDYVPGPNRHFDAHKYFGEMKLPTIKAIFYYKLGIENISDNKFKKRLIHAQNTRFTKNEGLKVPKTNNKYGDRTLECLVPKFFNSLPMNIKKCSRVRKLKILLKYWLCKNRSMYL